MSFFTADHTFDAQAFLRAAAQYARSKGYRDEDMPSTMLLHALETREKTPGQILSMDICLCRARDILSPRSSDGNGGKAYRDAMEHRTDDVRVMADGDEIRISECTVIDFGASYTAIAGRRMNRAARQATGNLRRARYLARLPFGHLPFIL